MENLECYSCGDEFKTLKDNLCIDCNDREDKLIKYKTKLSSTYRYDSIDELKELIEILDNPLIDNIECFRGVKYSPEYDSLQHSFGLVYTWSHWDDFDDNPMYYCVVLDGASF